jgi:hypothetical protein
MPAFAEDASGAERRLGLCATCRFARLVTSARGAQFLLCRRSEAGETDEPLAPAGNAAGAAAGRRWPKYPRLPVIDCSGYERT